MLLRTALLFALPFAAQLPVQNAQSAKTDQVPIAEVFPMPKEGITLSVDAKNRSSDEKKCLDLLDEFSRVTGVAIQMTKDVQAVLRMTPIGLNQTITIPPSEVYRVVEVLLLANDFAVVHLSDKEPRVWTIQSLANAGARGPQLRNDARLVPESELAQWAQHPATLITTTIDLPSTDVRTLSNSMRAMMTDANTQQIIPVGNTSLIVTGFAGNVAALARLMHAIDDTARVQMEKVKNEPKPQPVK